MTAVWQHTADVLADWFLHGLPTRDAIAARPELRRLPPADRAAVARRAQSALARLGWLSFALARDLEQLPPQARAAALVLAQEVASDRMLAQAAERAYAAVSHVPVALAPVLAAAQRLERLAAQDPDAALAVRWSMPEWLARRFRAELGVDAEALAGALLGEPPRTLRTNVLRCSRDELAARLAAERVPTRVGAWSPWALHADGDADLFATRAFADGCFEQQDEASQLGVVATAVPPGGKVLDACAGSGGKTLALAAALRNRGEVLATDVHRGRLDALRARLGRAGAHDVRAVLLQPDGAWSPDVAAFAAHADRVLIDAPCSGTGAFRRRPEARWRLREQDLASLARTQDDLLDRAAGALRPGARIVYATCSLLPSENEQRVAAFLERHRQIEVVRIAEVLGGAAAKPIADATGTFLSLRPDRHGCDGFFAAVLRRRRAARIQA